MKIIFLTLFLLSPCGYSEPILDNYIHQIEAIVTEHFAGETPRQLGLINENLNRLAQELEKKTDLLENRIFDDLSEHSVELRPGKEPLRPAFIKASILYQLSLEKQFDLLKTWKELAVFFRLYEDPEVLKDWNNKKANFRNMVINVALIDTAFIFIYAIAAAFPWLLVKTNTDYYCNENPTNEDGYNQCDHNKRSQVKHGTPTQTVIQCLSVWFGTPLAALAITTTAGLIYVYKDYIKAGARSCYYNACRGAKNCWNCVCCCSSSEGASASSEEKRIEDLFRALRDELIGRAI